MSAFSRGAGVACILALIPGPAARAQNPAAPPAAAAAVPATGRIAGRVVDRSTGRPIASARVQIGGQPAALETDLDGRYRSTPLAVGKYILRISMLGYRPAASDTAAVRQGQSTIVDVALEPAAIELDELVSTAAAQPVKTNSDAGLLAIQQNAPGVTDGVSAQAIARSPDKDAGEAVRRVTGITVVGGKFLVVRGLGERYSNALLNGAEMPNPVIEKKIAPLDIFPAGLLESVVASKTATPDKPGDFAGGSVELTTKDFPESRVLQFSVGQRFTDRSSFRNLPLAPRGGTDWLGFDDGRRAGPYVPFAVGSAADVQRILQSFHYQVWDPAGRRVAPGTTAAFTYGDQTPMGNSALGYVFSLTYENKTDYTPNRYYNISYLGQEGTASVNWGGVFNVTARLGGGAKVGIRNLYTRSADENTRSADGSSSAFLSRFYQVRYVERGLWQSQLFSSINFKPLFRSNLELKATLGRATIDDPDTHSINYNYPLEIPGPPIITGTHSIRSLADRTWSGQADWTVPLAFRHPDDAQVKVGGSYRDKTRSFDARDLFIQPGGPAASRYLDETIGRMAPDQAFAPENLGTYFTFAGPGPGQHDDAYDAVDRLSSAYAMIDAPLLSRLRLVGGLRAEQWKLTLKPGGKDPQGSFLSKGTVITRDEINPLWSGNLTWAVTDNMNIRMAGSRTLARPDSREISPGRNSAAGGIGDCEETGNPDLKESLITNADLRWELYPRPGELVAVSGFYKRFNDPIIEIRTAGSGGSGNNVCSISNAQVAELGGGEFEVRRGLDFLPGPLRNLAVGLNVSVVTSTIRFDPSTGLQARDFIGQSPYTVNGSLAFEPPGSPLSISVLFNYFADRIQKYANQDRGGGDPNAPPTPNPNWVEKGRGVLDAKVGIGITSQMRLTFSGKNLTRAPVRVREDSVHRSTVEYYNPGLVISATASYAF